MKVKNNKNVKTPLSVKISRRFGCRNCWNLEWDQEFEEGYAIGSPYPVCAGWCDDDGEIADNMNSKIFNAEENNKFPFIFVPLKCIVYKKYLSLKEGKRKNKLYIERMNKKLSKKELK